MCPVVYAPPTALVQSGSQALSQTESVSRGPRGAWLVHYQIGGQQLTDYWFYVHRRWVFDLVLSNPDAVKLYRTILVEKRPTVVKSHKP